MRLLHGEAARLKLLGRPWAIRRYLAQHGDDAKLHLGCGTHVLPGWLNADRFKGEADIFLDACAKLPFTDDTFAAVYSEHTLEHVPTDSVPQLLSEICRVTRPGGLFRVTVPDLEIHAREYVRGNDAFFRPVLEHYARKRERNQKKYWLVRTNGGAFMSRAVARFYRHRWMYDFATLEACLKEVGFREVHKQACQQGVRPDVAELDRPDRAWETLYVDAIK